MITDGNEKCHRMRCFSDDGQIEISGKIIEVGCDSTPVRGSYFCERHRSSEEVFISEVENDTK